MATPAGNLIFLIVFAHGPLMVKTPIPSGSLQAVMARNGLLTPAPVAENGFESAVGYASFSLTSACDP